MLLSVPKPHSSHTKTNRRDVILLVPKSAVVKDGEENQRSTLASGLRGEPEESVSIRPELQTNEQLWRKTSSV